MQKLLNPHAHSTKSDGELSIQEIEQEAIRTGVHQFVTDHNTVDAHRDFQSDYVGAGIEVKTQSGSDILICGQREGIIELFDAELAHRVDPKNPIYGEIGITATELTGLAREMDHEVILAHIGTCEGASILSGAVQTELARHNVLVELNGRIRSGLNIIAMNYAKKYRLPLIAGGDSHIAGYNQYASTTNAVEGNGDISTPIAMLKKLRRGKSTHGMQVSRPGIRETLSTVRQILAAGGAKVLRSIARCKQRQLLGS